jgi:hypothetical protein
MDALHLIYRQIWSSGVGATMPDIVVRKLWSFPHRGQVVSREPWRSTKGRVVVQHRNSYTLISTKDTTWLGTHLCEAG